MDIAGGDNFANIFDAGKRRSSNRQCRPHRHDTGLNLPSMLWASQWDGERAALAYRHLDTVLEVGLIRHDGSNCHAAALDPQTRAVTGLFSPQGWSNSSTWARGQAWAMLGLLTHMRRAESRTISTRHDARGLVRRSRA